MPWSKEKRAEYARAWRDKNPEKTKAAKRRYHERNRERIYVLRKAERARKRAAIAAQKAAWAKANPKLVAMQCIRRRLKRQQSMYNAFVVRTYRLTLADYESVLSLQGNRCAICLSAQANSRAHRLFVDHDHATGDLRTLLCNRCNSALGYFFDSPDLLRRAAVYLEAFRGESSSTDWPGRVRSVLAALPAASGEGRRPEGVAATETDAGPRRQNGGVADVADQPVAGPEIYPLTGYLAAGPSLAGRAADDPGRAAAGVRLVLPA